MISRNTIKVLIGAVAVTGLTGCGGSQQAATPTATLQSAPTTLSTTSTAGNVDEEAASQGAPPPTIVFDDSAARRFWAPVPVGQTPAEWEPEYLTRQELTKYEPLVDPDPAAWDIPVGGVTPEYMERVFIYLQTLESAIQKAAIDAGEIDTRVRNSALAVYSGPGAATFLEHLERLQAGLSTDGIAWTTLDSLDLRELETSTLAGDVPCAFFHVTYKLQSQTREAHQNQWFGLVRDASPNWLNPTGWRQATTAPASLPNVRDFSCEAAGSAP